MAHPAPAAENRPAVAEFKPYVPADQNMPEFTAKAVTDVLLGKLVREMDPRATLILGPVPSSGEDEVFRHYETGKETFRIQAEKVPNRRGVERITTLVKRVSANRTVLMVEHNLSVVSTLSDTITVLQRGEIRRHVNVFVDGEDAKRAQGVHTRVGPGSTVHVINAVSGG